MVVLTALLQSCATTIYMVRHAEKQVYDGSTMMGSNPDLSEAGLRRAKALADSLAYRKLDGFMPPPTNAPIKQLHPQPLPSQWPLPLMMPTKAMH